MTQHRRKPELTGIAPEEADTIIRPRDNSLAKLLVEAVRYRGILANLFVRELRRQYVDLRLGFIWIFSQPVIMTAIFVLLRRGTGANIRTDIPYPLYLLSGFIFWFIWVDACRMTAAADRVNAALISKVFFPRLYSPIAAGFSKTCAFAIGLIPIGALQAWYGILPSWTILLLPLIVLQALTLALSIGLIFAVLAIEGQDWDRVLGQILYLGMFVSPVIYSVDILPERFQPFYELNPLVGLLNAFRSGLSGTPDFPWSSWGYSCVVTAVLTCIAIVLFRRAETRLLDDL